MRQRHENHENEVVEIQRGVSQVFKNRVIAKRMWNVSEDADSM
jgi:hypothetical protein